MRIVAGIVGIVIGIYSLLTVGFPGSLLGHGVSWLGHLLSIGGPASWGDWIHALSWAAALLAILGGALCFAFPAIGGVLLAASIAAHVALFGANTMGARFEIPLAIAVIFALIGAIQKARRKRAAPAAAGFDRAKWNTLAAHDGDIAAAVRQLYPYGERWVDELGAAYMQANDRAALPQIVARLLEQARQAAAELTPDESPAPPATAEAPKVTPPEVPPPVVPPPPVTPPPYAPPQYVPPQYIPPPRSSAGRIIIITTITVAIVLLVIAVIVAAVVVNMQHSYIAAFRPPPAFAFTEANVARDIDNNTPIDISSRLEAPAHPVLFLRYENAPTGYDVTVSLIKDGSEISRCTISFLPVGNGTYWCHIINVDLQPGNYTFQVQHAGAVVRTEDFVVYRLPVRLTNVVLARALEYDAPVGPTTVFYSTDRPVIFVNYQGAQPGSDTVQAVLLNSSGYRLVTCNANTMNQVSGFYWCRIEGNLTPGAYNFQVLINGEVVSNNPMTVIGGYQ